MKALRRVMIFGLVWFFCFSLEQGRADDEVRTYAPYDGQVGTEFFSSPGKPGECVDYVKANRLDLAETSYIYAKNMIQITETAGFKVDAVPEKGAVIVLPNMQIKEGEEYITTGHVAIVTQVGCPGPEGNYSLVIKDANFDNKGGATPLIGEANYTYDPITHTVKYIDYVAYGGSQNKKYDTATSRNPDQFKDIQFIHENGSEVNTAVSIFNQYQIEPSADQLGFLTQKLIKGENVNHYFDSMGNNYFDFPNYYKPGKYLHSGAGGQKEYKILLKKFEISTDGSNWVTVGEGDVWLDLASAAANSTILANYASNAHIPPGTYRYYRLTHGTYYTIKGYVTDPISGVTYYTTSNFYQSSQPGDNSRDGISSTSAGQYGECVMKVNSYSNDPGFAALNGGDSFSWTQPFAQTFQITAGTRKITLTFNMGTGIAFIPNGWVNNGHVNFDTGGTPIIPVVTAQ